MLRLAFLLCLCAAPLQALTLSFPAPATQTETVQETASSYRLPIAAWAAAGMETRLAEGLVEQTAWKIEGRVATLDLIAGLRQQIEAQGWRVLFSCETEACGGYDFRFGLQLLTEPEMHVDLGDFRYLAAENGDQLLGLVVSRSSEAGFVQLIRIAPEQTAAPVAMAQPAPTPQEPAPPPSDFVARLEGAGSLVLADLVFASGSGELEPGAYPALDALAAYLAAHPDRKIALVGHTDASGALVGNIALSKARAGAVRKALVALGIAAERIEAEGVGYLAPRASNLTPEGRTENRRVEVMLTSTQ